MKQLVIKNHRMVSSMVTPDIEKKAVRPDINQEIIRFPPLHVYFHLDKNPSMYHPSKF